MPILITKDSGTIIHFVCLSCLPQYHVRSDSEAVWVRTIPVGGASVLKMLSSDNGEYVYVMTQEKVRGCGLLSGQGSLGSII